MHVVKHDGGYSYIIGIIVTGESIKGLLKGAWL